MTHAPRFCGHADEYVAFGQPYPLDLGRLCIYVEIPSDEVVPPYVRREIEAALDLWRPHVPFTLDLVAEDPPSVVPTIRLKFVRGDHGDGQPFDGEGGVIGHATAPPTPGWCHLDEAETWSVPDTLYSGRFRLAKVLAHEFGHNLGLGHSGVIGSLMMPRYLDHVLTLSNDDITGMRSLYFPDENQPPPDGGDLPPVPAVFWGENPTLIVEGEPLAATGVMAYGQAGMGPPYVAQWNTEGTVWSIQVPGSEASVGFEVWRDEKQSILSEPFPVLEGALTRADLSLPMADSSLPPESDLEERVQQIEAWHVRHSLPLNE